MCVCVHVHGMEGISYNFYIDINYLIKKYLVCFYIYSELP